jgi:hypothetical protein
MGALTGLFCCAIIVVISIVPWIGKDSFYRYEAIYIMCVSVATMILVLADIVRQKMTNGKAARGCEGIFAFLVLCLFAVLWVALAGVGSFQGPFLTTGNGKCGCLCDRPVFKICVFECLSNFFECVHNIGIADGAGYFFSWIGAAMACSAAYAARWKKEAVPAPKEEHRSD